jgi:ribosome-binding factor A
MNRRLERLSDLMQKEIGVLLQTEVRDPRIGFVTISRCEVTADLAMARIWVSVFGSDKEKHDTLIGLKQCAPYIRKLLSRRLTVRTTPALHFYLDEGLQHGQRIMEILSTLPESERADAESSNEEE